MTDTERSKASQFRNMVDQYLTDLPDHAYGWCQECESEVWLDTELANGPAESCEEHEPLCRFQEGGCNA